MNVLSRVTGVSYDFNRGKVLWCVGPKTLRSHEFPFGLVFGGSHGCLETVRVPLKVLGFWRLFGNLCPVVRNPWMYTDDLLLWSLNYPLSSFVSKTKWLCHRYLRNLRDFCKDGRVKWSLMLVVYTSGETMVILHFLSAFVTRNIQVSFFSFRLKRTLS